MFCYQCEQTLGGKGCVKAGVCGKDEKTADWQDVLIQVTKGISQYAYRAHVAGSHDPAIDQFVIQALFTTVTNVNFDPTQLKEKINQAMKIQVQARTLYQAAIAKTGSKPEALQGPVVWEPASEDEQLLAQAKKISVASRQQQVGETVAGLQELILYGLKGSAAYAEHAQVLGKSSQTVNAFFHEALSFLADESQDSEALLGMALKVGEHNLRAMELLDLANTQAFGHPQPVAVRVTPKAGKAILVSGHDLKDLELLLQQTEGKGISIYTHGEMLPAHGYPILKKYPHLVGNYGGAWQDQRKEFDEFPGAILMTTNCIQKPQTTYATRIFTTGLVAWPGVVHIQGKKDFSPVIQAALSAPGFAADAPEQLITVGFGHQAVLGVADKIVGAVQAGKIKHFYLIGGCDGAKPGRNIYTEAALAVPQDSVILTLACGKFRFNKLDFGTVAGLPRLMDIGQCNDAYSAIQITLALAKAFNLGVNQLPLTIILSWYEQKAVAILLTLLYLGIKNMQLGPSLPAFVTPPVLDILVKKFALRPLAGTAAEIVNLNRTV